MKFSGVGPALADSRGLSATGAETRALVGTEVDYRERGGDELADEIVDIEEGPAEDGFLGERVGFGRIPGVRVDLLFNREVERPVDLAKAPFALSSVRCIDGSIDGEAPAHPAQVERDKSRLWKPIRPKVGQRDL